MNFFAYTIQPFWQIVQNIFLVEHVSVAVTYSICYRSNSIKNYKSTQKVLFILAFTDTLAGNPQKVIFFKMFEWSSVSSGFLSPAKSLQIKNSQH